MGTMDKTNKQKQTETTNTRKLYNEGRSVEIQQGVWQGTPVQQVEVKDS